jgi:hypothetical protein
MLEGLHFADVAKIQKAVTDEFKKFQKHKYSEDFYNCRTAQKPVYIPMELILNKK